MLLPPARCEQRDLEGGMGIDPLEHLDQIDMWINVLHSARGEQTLNDADVACAHFRPAKQPDGMTFPISEGQCSLLLVANSVRYEKEDV